jgi:predicted anti-sigma-YlaC factor YlaD
VAGTRISVYAVMDYIKAGQSKEYILERLPILNRAQLDAVYDYIEEHQEEVERGYEAMVHRCAELEARYRQVQAERSPFPPDLSPGERQRLLRQKLEEMKQAARQNHDSHHPA